MVKKIGREVLVVLFILVGIWALKKVLAKVNVPVLSNIAAEV